jgi:hypothetical protein
MKKYGAAVTFGAAVYRRIVVVQRRGTWVLMGCLALLTGLGGCGDLFIHHTASLGGSTAGARGTVQVVFINNTDHRAVFTFGTYNPSDRLSSPDFEQFGLQTGQRNLGAGETSPILPGSCGRVFSVGSPRLLDFIRDNIGLDEVNAEAFVEGVDFYSTETGAEGEPIPVGSSAPLEALLGVDFPCGGLIVIHFEVADGGPNPFRMSFAVVPAESTR